MEKRKQTPADLHGGRTKRQPRDPSDDRRDSDAGVGDDTTDGGRHVDGPEHSTPTHQR